jgi:hypothetical protein
MFMGSGLAQLDYGPWFMDYNESKNLDKYGKIIGELNMICSSNLEFHSAELGKEKLKS